MYKLGCFQQAFHSACIQPREAASKQLNIQLVLLKIHIVQSGDLQLASGRGLNLFSKSRNSLGIEIQTGNGIVALGLFGLFFNRQDFAVIVKLNDSKSLGVIDVITENRCAAAFRICSSIFEQL